MPDTRPPDQRPAEPHEQVDGWLEAALARGASDLFLIPETERLAVWLKCAGRQERLAELPVAAAPQCVARLKVLAGMLTYRTTVAQDGVIRGTPSHPHAEFRVATLPTGQGERVTVRVLDPERVPQALAELGYAPEVLAALRRMLARPHGLLILTGPTGSGKSTTLYALLRDLLATGEEPASIITIEDPIECHVPMLSQVQVSRAAPDWGYAPALRAALRHDVKTLLIGELRDRDVVRVALDAALTGHRIITTFHAGDIPAVYARLLHFGFEPFLVGAAVTGVLSQRLLRRRDGTGFVPVAAWLEADDAWRDVVVRNPGLHELRRCVQNRPGADLAAVAAALVAAGLIEPGEANRL